MTAEELSAIVGVVLSLLFSYTPGVNKWYEALAREYKQLLMGVLLIVVAWGDFGLSCGGVVNVFVCDKTGALGLVKVLLAALIANQATYLISRRK